MIMYNLYQFHQDFKNRVHKQRTCSQCFKKGYDVNNFWQESPNEGVCLCSPCATKRHRREQLQAMFEGMKNDLVKEVPNAGLA
jgi:hypothetical protein